MIEAREKPIYSVSEDEFNEKWEKHREEIKGTFIKHGHTEESASQGFKDCYFVDDTAFRNTIDYCLN